MSQSEFEIIRRYFADSGLGFSRQDITLGIGDDAALISVPANQLLAMSLDVLVESVHFPRGADAALVANRSLAVNLSDLAAMAAQPLCFTLGLTLPTADADWLQKFSSGLLPLAQEFNCPLVGGDISRGPLSIAIQVQGLVTGESVIRRSGAVVGDQIYVSGSLGDGAMALPSMGLASQLGADFQFLDGQPSAACSEYFKQAFYKPRPRIELALRCAPYVNAGIDISDGLAGDLGHILQASAVGAVINTDQLPYSGSAMCCMAAGKRLRAALFGGDDYELCVTVAPEHCAELEAAARSTGVEITRIGEIVAGTTLQWVDSAGGNQAVDAASFQHFQHQDG